MTAPLLRDYQLAAVTELRRKAAAGVRRLLLVSPTGSGKTVMMADIMHGAVARGTPTLFVAHRRELIAQTSKKLDEIGVDHGIILAGHEREKPEQLVQVASVQTLARREKPPAGLLIIDEAHHARADSYQALVEHYSSAPVLGATATPWRTDGKGLKDLFDDVVVAASPRELIAQGHLVPFDGFGFENPALKDVATVGGDYNQLQLAERMSTKKLIGGIVERWIERARGLRTVAFAVDVKHSLAIVDEFRAWGIAAEHLDGETPVDERDAMLARLKSGETTVVSNCAVLTEGWDCPEAEVCILARPTKSLALYLQQAGRVLRPAPGKSIALIHDHAGCMAHHGLPDEDRDYSLTADVKRRDATGGGVQQCPECLRIRRSLEYRCSCGYVFEEPAAAEEHEQQEIEYIEGQVLSIDEIRKLRHASTLEKAAEFKRLQRVAERKGYKTGWAGHQYRKTYGVWPRFSDGVLATVEPARQPPIPLDRLRLLDQERQ